MKLTRLTLAYLGVLTISVGLYSLLFAFKEAYYKFIGKFEYEITDQQLFAETYLSDSSLTFLIGDLPIPGLKLNDGEILRSDKEYIFSKGRPIKAVYLNSQIVKSEGQDHLKRKAVEIVQDTDTLDNSFIYIYELSPKGKYRLLLP